MGSGTLALALGHTCRLKTMPCFVLMEELEKLRLKTLLWGQSGAAVSGEAGTMPSLQGSRDLFSRPRLRLFPSTLPGPCISLPLWQCFPVNCSGQMQCGPLGMFTQVPPLWQGLCLLQ